VDVFWYVEDHLKNVVLLTLRKAWLSAWRKISVSSTTQKIIMVRRWLTPSPGGVCIGIATYPISPHFKIHSTCAYANSALRMFSLILGKPTVLHDDDDDVLISKPVPCVALLFLNAMLTCDTSQTPVWETWLDQHDLSSFKDMTGAPNSLSVLKRQIDLGRIIEDMLSQTLPPKKMTPGGSKRWAEISLNRLNARLCSWHNALPGDMRWDRWGSSFDVVHPSIASLQYEIRNPHFANTNDTTVCSTTPHGYL
jgi:hypothetical protein